MWYLCRMRGFQLNCTDLLTDLLTYLLTPWSRVLLEKPASLQLVKKFPAFYGTRRFLTALTSARHLSLSWVSPSQSSYPNPTSWRSILILSSHLGLGLPSGLFPSGFPTSTLYNKYTLRIRNTHCFSTATIVARKRLRATLYAHTSPVFFKWTICFVHPTSFINYRLGKLQELYNFFISHSSGHQMFRPLTKHCWQGITMLLAVIVLRCMLVLSILAQILPKIYL